MDPNHTVLMQVIIADDSSLGLGVAQLKKGGCKGYLLGSDDDILIVWLEVVAQQSFKYLQLINRSWHVPLSISHWIEFLVFKKPVH